MGCHTHGSHLGFRETPADPMFRKSSIFGVLTLLFVIPATAMAATRSNGVIAYSHFQRNLNRWTVRTIDPVTGVHTLIVRGTSPAWSPSGRRLAFITPADEVAIHNLNGSITHTRVPVTGAEWDSSNDMAWSPDGNSLAYEYSSDPRVTGSEHIWVMNTHRPYEPRQVSTNGGMEPSWSPDSSEIVYGGFEADLWTVNADGTNDADLTNTPDIAESRPDWSPDGNSIAYLASSEQQRGLFVATASGADAHLVTPGASTCCGAPDWSPDGKQIAFIGDPGVDIVNSDGSDLRVITAAGYDAQPDWQASAAQ